MLYGDYTFSCVFTNEAHMPSYTGSTLRGVFGRSLRQVVCTLKRQTCDVCLLRQNCLYAKVFETQLTGKPTKSMRISDLPHPFVIHPPGDSKETYQPGERFECGLSLFGEINHSLPYFVYAFDRMGERGMGRRINGIRGQFSLESVSIDNKEVYSSGTRVVDLNGTVSDLVMERPDPEDPVETAVKVSLVTPLRTKQNGKLIDTLPFSTLTRIMIRRIASLFDAHGAGCPDMDFDRLIRKSNDVKILFSDTRWNDWERYSFRQRKRMTLGGIIGTIVYRGEMAEFMPLLKLSEKLNLGKNTSFGLGRIRTEIISES